MIDLAHTVMKYIDIDRLNPIMKYIGNDRPSPCNHEIYR